MDLDVSRGLRNALVRRVRRHAAVATLFRATDPALSERATGQSTARLRSPQAAGPTSQPTDRFVRATLLPAPASLPIGYTIGYSSITEKAPPQVEDTLQQSLVPSKQEHPLPSLSKGSDTWIAPVTLATTESKTGDAEWRRLQTIIKKHEEKQTAEEIASQVEMPTDTLPGKSELHETPPLGQGTDQPQHHESGIESIPQPTKSESAPAPLSREPSIQRAVSRSDTVTVPESPATQAQTGPPLHQETMDTTDNPQTRPQSLSRQRSAGKTKAGRPATVSKAPMAASRTGSRTEAAQEPDYVEGLSAEQLETQIDEREGPDADALVPQRPTDMERPTEPTIGTEAETASSDITAPTPPYTGEPSLPSGPPAQHLPLQAVWPVQRLEEPVPLAETERQGEQAHISASAPILELSASIGSEIPAAGGEVPEAEEIKNILRGIASGQPTDSSIEIIPPRRPRPVAPPPSKRQPPVESDEAQDVNSLSKPTLPVQMRQDSKPDVAQNHPSEKTPEPDLVHTNVGPLPADLWRLLDQSPPPDVEPQAATDYDTPVLPVTSAGTDVLVQRQPEAEAVQLYSLQETEIETTDHLDQHRPVEKLDTDELARRVYAEIKRRVAVEWERLRGRF